MTNTLTIGALVARVDAPTARYRVASIHGEPARTGYVRILPHEHNGREHALVQIAGKWLADGSEWSCL